eukprot:3005963-Alexandrium_andersonii.AAC.1
MQRDWALRTAHEMIKEHAGQRTVECDWKERLVKINGALVFQQERGDLSAPSWASAGTSTS